MRRQACPHPGPPSSCFETASTLRTRDRQSGRQQDSQNNKGAATGRGPLLCRRNGVASVAAAAATAQRVLAVAIVARDVTGFAGFTAHQLAPLLQAYLGDIGEEHVAG